MERVRWILLLQIATDVFYLASLFVVCLEAAAKMTALTTNASWPFAIRVGVLVPACCVMLGKWVVYYVPMRQTSKLQNPLWHTTHQSIAVLCSVAQMLVVAWFVSLLSMAGDATQHFDFSSAVVGFATLGCALVAIGAAAIVALFVHRSMAHRRVFGGSRSNDETSFDQSLADLDATEVSEANAVLRSEQSVGTELATLVLQERRLLDEPSDDGSSSEDLEGTLPRTKKQRHASKHNGKRQNRLVRMFSPASRLRKGQ